MKRPVQVLSLSSPLLIGSAFLGLCAQAAQTDKDSLTTRLANGSYAGIYEQPVRLTNGHYEGEPFVPGGASKPSLTLIGDLITEGDLDGDGKKDAAVLLVESSGGSGSFAYLSVVSLAGDDPKNLATTLLGDRVQVRSLDHTEDGVTLEMVVVGEGDAAPFPSQKVRKTYELRDRKLSETASEALGSLSLADIGNTAWVLRKMAEEGTDKVPEGTLTAEIKGDRIGGSAGCNRYFANIDDKGKGAVAIGPVGSTRMACPEPLMAQEQAFLEQMGKVERFGFRFGNLVLSSPQGVLIFDPKPD
ncbi:MAG: META domain-containing protein [Pseudomonadota bacterium]|nr:META domain-containing protein [Pseudomonadota bacterium]